MKQVANILGVTLRSLLRDRILHGLIGAVLLLLFLIPTFSLFSMRQVQELSITLTLSSVSSILLILTVLLGASSVWKDLEKRFAISVLGLPISRSSFLIGKFLGLCAFVELCCIFLGLVGLVIIYISSSQYPSDLPVAWGNVILSFFLDSWKYFLLSGVALFFSAISTSLFLPVFGTIAVYLAGSASQDVADFIARDQGQSLPDFFVTTCQALYYLLPNFSLFDLKVHAIYSLPIPMSRVCLAAGYGFIYCALLVIASVWAFSRRELS